MIDEDLRLSVTQNKTQKYLGAQFVIQEMNAQY